MDTPKDVKEIISVYTEVIDCELKNFFKNCPDLPLYGQLAYFMGFKNEDLIDEVTYGGKRFRSSLMLMLGEFYGVRDEVVKSAVALELYHNFTLIHDDVIDRDTYRRGRKTVWNLFGQDDAINSGDVQLLLVAEMLAGLPKEVQLFLLSQFRIVLEGQYLDFKLAEVALGDEFAKEESYNEMIRCKTAELIVAASKGAGLVAGLENSELETLYGYGYNLGMAYQVCDDVVSIWATGETTGKRSYGDIKEKKKTLPILFAHNNLDSDKKEKLEAVYRTENLDDVACEQVIQILDEVNTKEVMEKKISAYSTKAKEAAKKLAINDEQKAILCSLVDSLLPNV